MDGPTATTMLRLAEDARPKMRGNDEAWAKAQFEGRYPDMLAALDWFLEQERPDDGYRLASALIPFWMWTNRIEEGNAWFERALIGPVGSDARRARALYDHGYLIFWAGRYELSEQRFVEALALARAIGDTNLVALILAGQARTALATDPSTAVDLTREAIELTDREPDGEGRASATHVLGVALQMSGDLAGARAVMADRLAEARQHDDGFVVYVEAANLSMVERQLGNIDEAEALSLEALAIVTSRRDEMAVAWVINGLAAATLASGRDERAATLLGIAEAILAKAGGEWPPDEREQFDETSASLAKRLEPDRLARARAAGSVMTLDDATVYARGETD